MRNEKGQHEHVTGKFRGWLCRRCNTVLGMIEDDTNLLEMLIAYLDKNQI